VSLESLEARALPLSSVPDLESGRAHVWITRLVGLPVMEPGPAAARVDDLRRLRMGQRFVLRLLLGAYLCCPGRDVRIERGAAGKPKLADAQTRAGSGRGLAFNLSHAGDWLAIAVARDAEVGVDIERRARRVRARELARRWFGTDEAARLDTLDEDSARVEFLRRWSLREALVKARGETLAGRLGEIALATGEPVRPIRLPGDWSQPAGWDLHEITGAPELVGFVAAAGRGLGVRGFRLELAGA